MVGCDTILPMRMSIHDLFKTPRTWFVRDDLRVVPDDRLSPGEERFIEMVRGTLDESGPVTFIDVTTDGRKISFMDTGLGIVALVDGVRVGAFSFGTNYVVDGARGLGIGSSLLIAAMIGGYSSPSHFSQSGKLARIAARRRLAELAVETLPYGSWPDVVSEYEDLVPSFDLVRQPDGITCGPTSAAMAIDWLRGDKPNVLDVADAMGTDALTGTTDVRMARGLDQYGVAWSRDLETAEDPVTELKRQLRDGRCVVALRTLSLGKHWVLAYASTRAGILVACPATGIRFWPDAVCRRYWEARDYHSFMIKRAD